MSGKSSFSHLAFKYNYLMPLLAKFPQAIAYRLVSFYAMFLLASHLEERQAICTQMRHVFENQSDQQLQSWAEYFIKMLEREKLDTEFFQTLQTDKQVDNFVTLHNYQELLQAREQSRKVFITTGHFGRLWMAGIGLQRYGISVGTITRDSSKENVQQLDNTEFEYRARKLNALQQHLQGPFLVEGESVRPIYRALDDYVMALLIDVPYEKTKEGCIELPFLGKTARFPTGVAKIARRTNALIIPYYVFESRKGLDVNFYPAIEAIDLTETEIMQQLVSLLESRILANPEQWWLWAALPAMWQN